MIHSMTGFGEAEQALEEGILRLSLKSVNHRFFHSSIRLPPGNEHLEALLTERLRSALHRGHVTCGLAFERDRSTGDAPLPELDVERAKAYARAFEQLKSELGVTGDVDFGTWARFGELFRPPEGARASRRFDEAVVMELADRALAALLDMRATEGKRLQDDMERRIQAMGRLVADVETRAPARLTAERDRLRAAVQDLAAGVPVDEERLTREVAYLAEKWDINEEIVRLRSHMALFSETLENPDGKAVGKRLGFVIQEMHREANTIGSKANDSEISHAAVGMKEEIERLREQVENVE